MKSFYLGWIVSFLSPSGSNSNSNSNNHESDTVNSKKKKRKSTKGSEEINSKSPLEGTGWRVMYDRPGGDGRRECLVLVNGTFFSTLRSIQF